MAPTCYVGNHSTTVDSRGESERRQRLEQAAQAALHGKAADVLANSSGYGGGERRPRRRE